MLDLFLILWLTVCAVGGSILHKLDSIMRQPESVRQDSKDKQSVIGKMSSAPVEPILPYNDQQLIDAFRALATSKVKER